MQTQIEEILSFRCPRWEDLPEEPVFNKDVVAFINENLNPILHGQEAITSTMIQNYSKWEVIPALEGRKYDRRHIAILIIIILYKQILNINGVKEGIELQIQLLGMRDSFNKFADSMDLAIHQVFSAVKQDECYTFPEMKINYDSVGIQLVANAFASKLLATLIIESNGYQNLGG